MSLDLQRTKVIVINVTITFLEAFLAAWALTGNEMTENALLGAGAAGASVAWNTVVKPLFKKHTQLYK